MVTDGPRAGVPIAGAGVLAARAGAHPDAVALAVDGGDDLTYGAWERRSNAVARGLMARGARTGDWVGLLFDGVRGADLAVARLGVLKAGGVAVLLSPGAAPPDLARAVSSSAATGLLGAAQLAARCPSVWAAKLADVEAGRDDGPLATLVDPAALAELAYPPAPLAHPRPHARSHGDLVVAPEAAGGGPLVHAWPPGSAAGQHALALVLAGAHRLAATMACFSPDRLCALVAAQRADAVGLTPALAGAVIASGAASRHDVGSVTAVLLSSSPSPGLRAALEAAFAGAEVRDLELDRAPASPAGPGPWAPAAVSQESMVWHEQLTPGSFNLPCLVRRYQGPLDVAALGWALSELVRRHQPLRSTFELVDGAAHQVVGAEGPDLAVVELDSLSEQERDAEVARLLADATGRPFDLVRGPLFEPRLLRVGADDNLLVIRLHHSVFDDWSVGPFRRELAALYTVRLDGAPSPLVEPTTSFGHFARRERDLVVGEPGAAQRSWWRKELRGGPLAVQLGIGDDEAAPEPGEPVRLDLPPALSAGLRALAPRLRATPFMTVLAAFSVLLSRCTGQDDLVIATVVAHRNQSDLEPLIGCFTKKVPLRLRLEGDPPFPELVARTRASLLGALAHQDVSFDVALHEALGRPAAEHGVVPQVAVVFQGETPQRARPVLPGVTTSAFDPPPAARRERHFSAGPGDEGDDGAAPAWGDGVYLGTFLILSLVEDPDGMALVARGVFPRPAGRRLLEQFQALLGDVAAGPDRRVSALSAGGGPVRQRPGDAGADLVEVRGFRARRSPLEAALARCPGVADVALAVRHDPGAEPRLVAYVVASADPPPTVAQLRHALWTTRPGALWPAAAVVVDALPRLPDGRLDLSALPAPDPDRPPEPAPEAAMLAGLWGEVRGEAVTAQRSYWQDFSFLEALAQARAAGLAISDEQVARNRTPETLAADVAATGARRRRRPSGSI